MRILPKDVIEDLSTSVFLSEKKFKKMNLPYVKESLATALELYEQYASFYLAENKGFFASFFAKRKIKLVSTALREFAKIMRVDGKWDNIRHKYITNETKGD